MAKRLQEYVKYSIKELESYTKQDGACVRKMNTNLHISMGPYCLADFKHALSAHIMRRKVGYYDASLEGIVLDIKNIKVLGTAAALRADDPSIHIDVNADCYVFRPSAGAILSGVVKHVGNRHIGVIIYRVFNVSIRFAARINKEQSKMDDTLQFRIKNYNLQNVFPYIEGDLVTADGDKILDKFIKLEPESGDSGIEERENRELNELVTLIKQEHASEDEAIGGLTPKAKKKQKSVEVKRKRKASASEASFTEPMLVKTEPSSAKKKHKTSNSELNNTHTEKVASKSKKHKVKSEILDATQIKTEKEENVIVSPAKKRRSKTKNVEGTL